MAPLASQACRRLWSGFRLATLNSYQRMFKLFLAFLVVEVSLLDILAFMEYLAQSGMSPDHITNHITATRSMCIVYGCNTLSFRDQRIPLFIRSLKLTRYFSPKLPMIMDDTLLIRIITASVQLQYIYWHYIYWRFSLSSGSHIYCHILFMHLVKQDSYVLVMLFFQTTGL